MPLVPFEANYYSSLREGMDFGYRMSGDTPPDELPEDVEQSLERTAKRKANQLRKMIVDDPKFRERLAEAVDEWISQPGPLKLTELTEHLAPMFGARRALVIARTETAWSMNNAAASIVRANGWDKIIWLAALDACDICATLDGQPMTLDEYQENAVAHPNCRCSFEVFDGDDEDVDDDLLDEAAAAGDVDPDDLGAGSLDRDVDLVPGE